MYRKEMDDQRKYFQSGRNLLSREYPTNSGEGKTSYYLPDDIMRNKFFNHGESLEDDYDIKSSEIVEFPSFWEESISTSKQVLFKDTKLHSNLLNALRSSQYISATQVQKDLLTVFTGSSRAHLKICAPRKCGKTMAVLLCILNEILSNVDKKIKMALILCPTYELAELCYFRLQQLLTFSATRLCLAVKGKSFNKNKKITETVIVATPEKASEIIPSLDFRSIKYLFIDDADYLRNPKSQFKIFSKIFEKLCSKCRIIVTSDTESEALETFFNEQEIVFSDIKIETKTNYRNVKQVYVVYKDNDERINSLVHFLSTKSYPGQKVIFCETTDVVIQLEEVLLSKKFRAVKLHGGLCTGRRNDALKRFQNKDIEILVTTQAFLRVMSADHIAQVINFDQVCNDSGLLLKEYENRKFLLNGKSFGIFVNFVDETYEKFFFFKKKTIQDGKNFYGDAEIITVEKFKNL